MLDDEKSAITASSAASLRQNSVFAQKFLVAAMIAALAALTPAAAQAPGLGALDGAAKGLWEVRFRDGTAKKRVCVRNGRELLQLKHAGLNCGRFSVVAEDNEVTVQYTCRGSGYGRTNLRVETAKLVQLESHGVANELPFQFSAEARHIGACD